jgi:hypothetical protein
MNMRLLPLLLAATLVGCATSNTGVVPIGNGLYMISKMGRMLQYTGGEVKVELYQEAATFCAKSGKQVVPGPSTSKDSGYYTYASAEIQFRCE